MTSKSKKVTSALVATLLVSHMTLGSVTMVAAHEESTATQTQGTTKVDLPTSTVTDELQSNQADTSAPTDTEAGVGEAGQDTAQSAPAQDENSSQTEETEAGSGDDSQDTAQSAPVQNENPLQIDEKETADDFDLKYWSYTEEPDAYVLTEFNYYYPSQAGPITIPGKYNGKQVYIELSSKNAYGVDVALQFDGKNISSVSFKEVDGHKVKVRGGKLDGLFASSTITSVDASGLDTSDVTSMVGTFYGSSIQNVNGLSSWDVSQVTDMHSMFWGCKSLSDLSGLSSWKVSNVTNMSSMFSYSTSLSDLSGLSSWKVSKVTDMGGMFYGSSSLSDLKPISGWNVSNVTNMRGMFTNCENLHVADLSEWNLNGNANIERMFATYKFDGNTGKYQYQGKQLLIISKDTELTNYNYKDESINPLTSIFTVGAEEHFADGTTGQKSISYPQVISDGSDARITKLLEEVKDKVGTPTTSQTGTKFNGWVEQSPARTYSAKDIYQKLTATYSSQWLYRVSYGTNGGSAIEEDWVKAGSLVKAPADPKRDGYVFKGWYKDEQYTQAWDFATDKMLNEERTLYAKWEKIPDIPTTPMDNLGTTDSQQVLYLSAPADAKKVTLPSTGTRAGLSYVFAGVLMLLGISHHLYRNGKKDR